MCKISNKTKLDESEYDDCIIGRAVMNYSAPYDLKSIMHYKLDAAIREDFSKNKPKMAYSCNAFTRDY